MTGGAPVVCFSKTRAAREEASQTSQNTSVDTTRLGAGAEDCPVARGEHDRDDEFGNDSLDVLAPADGTVSEWLQRQNAEKPISSARAHGGAEDR